MEYSDKEKEIETFFFQGDDTHSYKLKDKINDHCAIGVEKSTSKEVLFDPCNNVILSDFCFDHISYFNEKGYAFIRKDNKTGVIHTSGKIILPCEYEFPDISYYDEIKNYYPFRQIEKNNKIGIVDQNFEFILSCKFSYFQNIETLKPDDYLYKIGFILQKNNLKFGIINIQEERTVLPCCYDKIFILFDKKFNEHYFCAKENNKVSLFTLAGQKLEEFDDIFYIYNHTLIIKSNSKIGFYSLTNKKQIQGSYDQFEYPLEGQDEKYPELIFVEQNKLWGIFDLNKRLEILPCQYYQNTSKPFFYFTEGYSRIHNQQSKWGIINLNGNIIVDCQYESMGFVFDKRVPIKIGFKWTVLNIETNKILFEPQYDEIRDYKNGFAQVLKFDKWGYIDISGKNIIPCIYDEAFPFSEGLANVKLFGKYGYVNENNTVVIPFRFLSFGSFKDGYAHLRDINGESIINKRGKIVEYIEDEWHEQPYHNYDAETWEAMTDGQLGDYPGSSIDYDKLK